MCGYSLTYYATASGTWEFVYGTGTVCGTGQSVVDYTGFPAATAITGSSKVYGGGNSQILMTVPSGNDLCILVAGTSPFIGGSISWVQK
jgi:hypothetical protein